MSSSKGFLLLGAIVAGAGLLSGCATGTAVRSQPVGLSTEQFKTPVTLQPQQLLLAPHGQGLSPAQQAAVYDTLKRWRTAPGGPILVETANGAGAEATMATTKVTEFLRGYGVTDAEIQVARYDGGADPRAPIRVSFPVYAVDIPKCGQVWENLARSPNQVPANFGCATTANIAAMVANPADLAFPEDSTAIDATRAQNVLEKYRSGSIEKPSATVTIN
jgi:pilus assembly protein CpaD